MSAAAARGNSNMQTPAMPTVAVLGAGKWGAAFGGAISDQCRLVFWDISPRVARLAARQAQNAAAEENFNRAVAAANAVVVAVSSAGFAAVLRRLAAARRRAPPPVVWLTKGFAPRANAPLCEVAARILGKNGAFAACSGPSFAEEVAAGLPAALTLAVNRRQDGAPLLALLHRRSLRLYLSADLPGVCVGGAVKNIVAIAAGVCDGMQLGENARAAVFARGLAEMTALGVALGGRAKTFAGLAGAGDLLLTCVSGKSRNYRLGVAIGKRPRRLWTPPALARAMAAQTCEGAAAVFAAQRAARKSKTRAPIVDAVAAVLGGKQTPANAAARLLDTPPRAA